ncbi:amiloride-sensitive sodium channel subunit gamma-like [Ylistrum balloti]|uniref:amiloride-sensitive sodium channel subunit gamma-like n=1 Tax=Ylistrum balloti TaxID=509963 RepID=UPI0029058193|nr:amiloride-sensitive sodium channel subunit gamma-like [Ylistrum balloti]
MASRLPRNGYIPESNRIYGYIPDTGKTDGQKMSSGRMDGYGGMGSDRMDGHKTESDMASRYIDIGNRGSDMSVVSLDSKGKRKSFGRVIERFAEKTSMQGVPYINSAKTRAAKIIWTILLIGAIGMMVLHLYYLANQFFVWPKTTVIELGFSNLQLPAITICNVNVVRHSKLMQHDDSSLDNLRALAAAVDPTKLDPSKTTGYIGTPVTGTGTSTGTGTGTNPNIPGQTGKRRKRAVETYEDLDLADFGKDNTIAKDTSVGPRDTISDIENTFTELYMDTDRDTRVSIGHTIDDMLVSCAFNGQTCYPENFTLFQTPSYGNCYTIESPKFISQTSGPPNGLKLIIYVDNRDYIKGITQGYGARVTLHYPGTIPDPENLGFYVSSAFETDIGLKLIDIQREGEPYGECTNGEDFEQKYHRKYTRQACLTTCEQESILSRCGCYQQKMQEIFHIAERTSVKACNTTSELQCQAGILNEIKAKSFVCSCPNPCMCLEQMVNYFYTVKEATFGTFADANFLKLIVYYEDLNYEKIEETPEIETAQFASDVGGAIGLWIGLSMLSMFEVVQLLVELCGYGASKCKKDEAKKEKARRKRQQRRIRARQNEYAKRYSLGPDRTGHVNGVFPAYRGRHYTEDTLPDYRDEYTTPNHSMNGYQEMEGYIMYKGPSFSERY